MFSLASTFGFLDNPNINWKSVILGLTIGKYAFDNYLEYRQYQVLKRPSPPASIKAEVSQETFEKSQVYSRAKTHFRWVNGAWDLLNQLVVIGTDFLPAFWSFSGTVLAKLPWFSGSVIAQSVVFLILKSTLDSVLELPFSYYRNFVLEEKYGFNKMTVSFWIKDWLKQRAVFTLLGAPLTAAFLKVLSIAGENVITYGQVFFFFVQLFFMTIMPTLIMPLFDTFTPLEEGELKVAIEELASREKFPLTKLLVVDGSKRSSHSNAYFVGMPWSKQIVLYDTLIKSHTKEELVSVLAHEIGHWQMSHLPKQVLLSQLYTMMTFASFSAFAQNKSLFANFGFTSIRPDFIGLFLVSYITVPFDALFSFFSSSMTRKFEYEADKYGKDRGYGEDLAQALIKLQKENLSTMDADPLYSSYHFSHPLLSERLSALGYVSKEKVN